MSLGCANKQSSILASERFIVKTFYSYYTKNLGKISNDIFKMFWSRQFNDCSSYISQVISLLGSAEELGLGDLLIYNYCRTQTGEGKLDLSFLPAAPTREEILQIYAYEKAQEDRTQTVAAANKFIPILSQPAILNKAVLATKIGIDTGCEEAIETGTFLGGSSYLFSGSFSSVETIEADHKLYEVAKGWLETLGSYPSIRCHVGNSGSILGEVLGKKNTKQLIFLDGHFSGGVTTNQYGDCPLIDELTAINRSGIDCSIVIDDARCMNRPGYPSFEQIFSMIPSDRQVTIRHDQIIIT